MTGAAAAGCAVPLAGGCASLAPSPFFGGRDLPIGVQLYTFGDLLRTDLEGTLRDIARIGYKTVEIPSYMGKTPAQLRAFFDAAGLRCTSAHVGLRAGTAAEPGLLGDLDALARDMSVIGARHVIAPILTAPDDLKVEAAAGVHIYAATASAMTALVTALLHISDGHNSHAHKKGGHISDGRLSDGRTHVMTILVMWPYQWLHP